jgi:mannose-6-phosphate isomerase-like protein (cupin superfamily)
MRTIPFATLMALVLIPTSLSGQVQTPTLPPPISLNNEHDDAGTILARYGDAWRGADELALPHPVVLGFEVQGDGGGSFHIRLPLDGPAAFAAGPAPEPPLVVFDLAMDVLRRLDRGELNIVTALGQARASDPTPVVLRFGPGFSWTPEQRGLVLPLLFHFWNREWPEVIRFGEGTTCWIHGGELTGLYYDAGLRTTWGRLAPGTHINADPDDQVNPFPTLLIVTRGVAQARLGGRERTLQEGEAVLIPAGMTHEAWAGDDQYAECVIIMFGPGA